MKRQKHYAEKSEIFEDIRNANRDMDRVKKEAEDCDKLATSFFLAGNSEDGKFQKVKADKLWDKANRIKNVRLKRLKETLSAFQTDTFAFVEEKSVVLQ